MVGEPALKDSFLAKWQEVKPIALKVTLGFETAWRIENGEAIPDTHPDVQKFKQLKDFNALWFTGLMIRDIERATIYGIRLNTINSLAQVHGTLNSESYWTNVWGNDDSSEEAQNLRQLAAALNDLLKHL